MAAKKSQSVRGDKFLTFKKLFAAVAMIAFVVIIISGVRAEARFTTIAFRASVAMVVIFIISRVVIRILAGYEEMNSGKA